MLTSTIEAEPTIAEEMAEAGATTRVVGTKKLAVG
jgi:hypothetical protein